MKLPQLINRSAWYLRDYADLWVDAGLDEEHPEGKRMLVELKELAERMAELDRSLAGVSGVGIDAMAGFVHNLLTLAGGPRALYFKARGKRFRVVGVSYQRMKGEELVGVYNEGVEVADLIEDMQEVMGAKS